MIDLHLHTKHSDGTDDVISLLKKSQEKGLEIISITDHDTCIAYNHLKNIHIRDYYSGEIITGVELKTIINGIQIELLGYNVDPNYINQEVDKYYTPLGKRRLIEKGRLKEICQKLHVILDTHEKEEFNPHEEYAGTYIYNQIIKHEENKKYFKNNEFPKNFSDFYRHYITNPNSLFFINMIDLTPTPDKIINLIRESGGLVFIPHVFAYGENSLFILNNLLDNYHIDGIECFYSDYSEEETKFLTELCQKRGLHMSGGSDYHGTNRPYLNLGIGRGNLIIAKDIINSWYDTSKTYRNK
jgi:3',5'-nucleoside bisphosphate phosphatase